MLPNPFLQNAHWFAITHYWSHCEILHITERWKTDKLTRRVISWAMRMAYAELQSRRRGNKDVSRWKDHIGYKIFCFLKQHPDINSDQHILKFQQHVIIFTWTKSLPSTRLPPSSIESFFGWKFFLPPPSITWNQVNRGSKKVYVHIYGWV